MNKYSYNRTNEVYEFIHKSVERNLKRVGTYNENIVIENKLIFILCKDFDIEPHECANRMKDFYKYDMTSKDIIKIFREMIIANPNERKELLVWAEYIADLFVKACNGNKKDFYSFEKLRKTPALKNGKKHRLQERFVTLMIYAKYPDINIFDDINNIYLFGNTLMKYFFYDMADAICKVYNFVPLRNINNEELRSVHTKENKISYEDAIKRIKSLEEELKKMSLFLDDLKNDFNEQIENAKFKEAVNFFSQLNSEKYGYVLDQLLMVNKNIDILKEKNCKLPIEVNSIFMFIKRLVIFLKDNNIEPIMKFDSVQNVVISDIENCRYDGSAFASEDEVKKVRVYSPGWIYKDKQIQISRPYIKEEF